MFLYEEFLLEEECLNENFKSASDWINYYLTGKSDETLRRISEEIENNVTSASQANFLLGEIDEAIMDIRANGISTEGILVDLVVIFFVPHGIAIFIAKEIIKIFGFKGARKQALRLLEQHKEAVLTLKKKNDWV